MKKQSLIIVFLLFSAASAYFDTGSMTLTYSAEGNITIDHQSTNAELISLIQKVYLYMQDEVYLELSLNDFVISEEAGLKLFRLNHYGDTDLINWGFSAKVLSERELHNLTSVPEFPYDIDELPASARWFLQPSLLIDSNDEIINTANDIVAGAPNYLEALGRIAEWVTNNLVYSPTNEYFNYSLKASEIISERKGVCDEFSILFMSLARAVGVPVRYSYGYAYSNVENIQGFGPHAWVEAYVPDYGWVPFDMTYKQYGWIDSSHIRTYSTYNITNNLISTSATGYDPAHLKLLNYLPDYLRASLNTGAVGFINVESTTNEEIVFDAEIKFSKEKLAEREYFLATISVTNPYPYYVPISFTLSTTNEMEFVDSSMHNFMLLKPNAVTNKYVLLRTPRIGSAVIHPFSFKLPGSHRIESRVTVYPDRSPTTTLEQLQLLILSEENLVSDLLIKSLSVNPSVVYDETPYLNLSLRNNGALSLDNITIDVVSSLTNPLQINISSLNINEVVNKFVPLELNNNTGKADLTVFVSSSAGVVSESVELVKAVPPSIVVELLGEREYIKNEKLNLTLNIDNINSQNISLMNITFRTPKAQVFNQYNPGKSNVTLNFNLPAEILGYGNNSISFIIDYADDYGSVFNETYSANLLLEGAWYDVIIEWFASIIIGIASFFNALTGQ